MINSLTAKQRFDHLAKVICSERFLTKQGLGNEVPFFICPFSASEVFDMESDIKNLAKKIGQAEIRVLDINLYDLSMQLLSSRSILDEICIIEPGHKKNEIKELLQSVLDPASHIIPEIARRIASEAHDVIFISGVGEVFPYIRSHNVLNNLQSTARR